MFGRGCVGLSWFDEAVEEERKGTRGRKEIGRAACVDDSAMRGRRTARLLLNMLW